MFCLHTYWNLYIFYFVQYTKFNMLNLISNLSAAMISKIVTHSLSPHGTMIRKHAIYQYHDI